MRCGECAVVRPPCAASCTSHMTDSVPACTRAPVSHTMPCCTLCVARFVLHIACCLFCRSCAAVAHGAAVSADISHLVRMRRTAWAQHCAACNVQVPTLCKKRAARHANDASCDARHAASHRSIRNIGARCNECLPLRVQRVCDPGKHVVQHQREADRQPHRLRDPGRRAPASTATRSKSSGAATAAVASASGATAALTADCTAASRLQPARHGTALHCTALHCAALHCTALHCAALRCTARRCAARHGAALRCAALYCTARHCSAVGGKG